MDIAIAGMGMGGLCLAGFLAKQGHNIVIYDRMDQPGPVGSGFVLQPTGLLVLERLGLREETEARAQRIDRMLGKLTKNNKIVLDVGYPKDDYGIAVIRWVLFDILYRHARDLCVKIETRHNVTAIEEGPRPRLIFENGAQSPAFDLVVDTMGARSPLRAVKGKELKYGALWVNLPWQDDIGFDRFTLEQRYNKASTMIGVLPLGKGNARALPMTTFFWSLRHRDFDIWKQDGISAWADKICNLWPEVAPFLTQIETFQDQITHARYRHHTHYNPVSNSVARLGDSWHGTSPQLGQGANMAFLDALAMSEAFKKNSNLPDILKDYAKRRRLHIYFYQILSYYLTPFYQSDNRTLPFLRDYLIAPTLRGRGMLHAMVAAMVTGRVLNPIKRATR